MGRTLICNARVVTDGSVVEADVLIDGDRIVQVGGAISAEPPVSVIDARGRWLLPGMIDDQVHFREPGLTHKGDIATESAAALAGRNYELHGNAEREPAHDVTRRAGREVRARGRPLARELRVLPRRDERQYR